VPVGLLAEARLIEHGTFLYIDEVISQSANTIKQKIKNFVLKNPTRRTPNNLSK
jgi:hypothetical protein